MLYRELALVVREQRAVRKGMGNNYVENISLGIDGPMPIGEKIVYLRSFCVDRPKHIHNSAFEGNKHKFNSDIKSALMFGNKNTEGEISHAL